MNRYFIVLFALLFAALMLCSCSGGETDDTAAPDPALTTPQLPMIPEDQLPWDDFDDEDEIDLDDIDAVDNDTSDADAKSDPATSDKEDAPSVNDSAATPGSDIKAREEAGDGGKNDTVPATDTATDTTAHFDTAGGSSTGNAIDLPVDYD